MVLFSKLQDIIDDDNRAKYILFRFLTKKPHIAGKERNNELARSLYKQWKDYGFDDVDLSNYTVLLDYVDRSNYNVLTLQDSDGDIIYTANTTQEELLVDNENDPDVPPPFNAYSGVGQAKVSHIFYTAQLQA